MGNDRIPFYARVLLVIGGGVALAIALDNIAIGIGVASIFLMTLVLRRRNFVENTGENNE